MKRSKSLRTQLRIFMTILVALQSVALLAALVISQVFSILDSESVRIFSDTAENRAESFNDLMGELVEELSDETQALGRRLENTAAEAGTSAPQLYAHEDAYETASALVADSLLRFMQAHAVSGSFVVLNGSGTDPADDTAHAAIYIRNYTNIIVSTSDDYSSYMVEIGPYSISQQYKLPLSSKWDLDIHLDPGSEDANFYTRPLWAAQLTPGSELVRYGYWTSPSEILNDGQQVVTYTLPLIDANGEVYGVYGVEFSLTLLTQMYLPYNELPYENSFYAIAKVAQSHIDLNWYIPSGTMAQIYLQSGEKLTLSRTQYDDLAVTSIDELGDMYCSLHTLQLYSANSPFHDGNDWMLIAFVRTGVLNQVSTNVRMLLYGSILLTAIVGFVGVYILSFLATRKIRRLSRKVRRLNAGDEISIERTGLGEVDELSAAVEKLSRSVVSASKRTSKIMELTGMPIGCFEVLPHTGEVFLTEYAHTLLGLEAKHLTPADWDAQFKRITAMPEPEQEDIYRNPDENNPARWLRILQTETDDGIVGTILDVTEQVEEHHALAQKLDHDALTGLYSRTAFRREAEQLIQQKPGEIGALIFADLDNLKFINDNYGHEAGDTLLRIAGEMFATFERMGAVVARIAGDEFAIYLHATGSRAQMRHQLFSQFAQISGYTMQTPDGKTQRIRFSAGIAWYPEDSASVEELLKLADFAMYEAKHHRKGTVVEFDPHSYRENVYILENRESISKLLDEEQLYFVFQPIVELATGKLYGYEALMRSHMPEFRSPLEILAVAAAQSKLYQLELLAVSTAYKYLYEHKEAFGGKKLFINSMPSQELGDEVIDRLGEKYPGIFGNVVIEITEDETSPASMIQQKANTVRRTGQLLAIDDFGAGYSNELRVLSMSPDFIKIDIGIVQGISKSEDKRLMVQSILSIAGQKGIRTIAEGVEDEDDLATIMWLGVDYVQGYYTGRPAPELVPPREEALQKILQLWMQLPEISYDD